MSRPGRAAASLWIALWIALGAIGGARAADGDADFLAGLRERRLYRLAEVHAAEQWSRDDLSNRDRVELALQLAQVYTDHALASPPADRASLWEKAEGVCDDFLEQWPGNPRRPLVETQRALVALARGSQLREETAGTADGAEGAAAGLEYLRGAVRGLSDAAAAIAERLTALRLRPPSELSPDALTASELESLAGHLSLHLGRAYRQIAFCYPPRSADRDDALLQALQRLEGIAGRREANELVWLCRIEALACRRELNQIDQAAARLAGWAEEGPPAEVAVQLSAERVRLLLAQNDISQAGRIADEALAAAGSSGAAGELALARLEASVAAWRLARPEGAASSAAEMTAEVAAIRERFGPYWGRRAQLLVGNELAGSGLAGNGADQGDGRSQLLVAEHLYLNGRIEESLAAYDRAAAALEQEQDFDQAVAAAMTAAAIEREAGRQAVAAQRYRTIAVRAANAARAAAAHRLALLSIADLLREYAAADAAPTESASLVASYEQLLREHIARWPQSTSADDARLWLGQLLAGRGNWTAAIATLREIGTASPRFAAAAPLVARGFLALLNAVQEQAAAGDSLDRKRQQAALLRDATDYLQPIVAAAPTTSPADWSSLTRSTVVALAELHLRYAESEPAFADELLRPLLGQLFPSPHQDSAVNTSEWTETLLAIQVAVQARLGRVDDAGASLRWLAANRPRAVRQALWYLEDLLSAEGMPQSEPLGRVALLGLDLLPAPTGGDDDLATRLRLGRLRAAALAAAGQRRAAAEAYAELIAHYPQDGQLQERRAALLAAGDSPGELSEALSAWQQIEEHSRRGGSRWRRARHARLELLTRLGQREEAEKLLRLTRLLYPDWTAAPTP